MQQIVIFYLFSCLSLLFACFVVCLRNTVKAVLSLILCFFFTACLWLLLNAEFLAIVLILVYVGAVLVLFLFVVMMIDVTTEDLNYTTYRFYAVFVCVVLFFFISYNFLNFNCLVLFTRIDSDIKFLNILCDTKVSNLGVLLYTSRLFVFELAGILLLVGIVSAIVLSFRGVQKDRKIQNVFKQITKNSNVSYIEKNK